MNSMENRNVASDLEIMRHSFAHVLAQAVLRVYPNTKLGIGPVVEDGFYHDFLFDNPIKENDLTNIEKQMNIIIEEELPFQHLVVPKEQAFDILSTQGQIFKSEILQTIEDENINFYKTGTDFIDLCRGPHVAHTGHLRYFKLTGISGSYWNNNKQRPKMQRIHAVAFKTESELTRHFNLIEERKQKDHKKIAKQLNIHTTKNINGANLPVWEPNGNNILNHLKAFIKQKNIEAGYNYIRTPMLARADFFNKNKSTQKYNKYSIQVDLEGSKYQMKSHPMAFFLQNYKRKKRSYKDLPFQISELSNTIRQEKENDLSGFFRLRNFIMDANLTICTKDQLEKEIKKAIQLTTSIYSTLKLDNYKIELNLRGRKLEQYEGNPKTWGSMEDLLVKIVKQMGLVVYEVPDQTITNGPALSFIFKDVYNNPWKLGTIRPDVMIPYKNKLKFINNKGKDVECYSIYRSSCGSIERLLGILTEKFGGAFPLWIAPIQLSIIPVSDKFEDYATQVYEYFQQLGISVKQEKSSSTLQNKIRKTQKNLIPYMAIIGEKEQSTNTISIRPRSGQDLGMMKIEEFAKKIRQEIKDKVVF